MDLETIGTSFLLKRRQMVEKHHRSRRQQIFSRTRKILDESDHLQTESNFIVSEQVSPATNSPWKKETKQQYLVSKSSQQGQSKKSKPTPKKKWEYYKNFQYPQWMTQIPENLHEYYFCVRPVGQRVFIRIKRHKMLLISMYGQVIETFSLSKATYNSTLFEGYFIKEQNHIIISDLIVWKQNPMSSSEFEFRLAWLLNNFSLNIIESLFSQKNVKISIMDFFNVNKPNLITVYQKVIQLNGKTDGFLFYHKDSFYLHEVNPAVYLWKDVKNAPMLDQEFHLLDNSHQKKDTSSIQDQQKCQKELSSLSLKQTENHFYGEYSVKDGLLHTYDKVPLTKINSDQEPRLKNYQNKCIAKFTFESLCEKNIQNIDKFLQKQNFQFEELEIQGGSCSKETDFPYEIKNLKIISTHDTNSRIPDPLSKIIWKHNFANNIRISFDMILNEFERQELSELSHGKMDLE